MMCIMCMAPLTKLSVLREHTGTVHKKISLALCCATGNLLLILRGKIKLVLCCTIKKGNWDGERTRMFLSAPDT